MGLRSLRFESGLRSLRIALVFGARPYKLENPCFPYQQKKGRLVEKEMPFDKKKINFRQKSIFHNKSDGQKLCSIKISIIYIFMLINKTQFIIEHQC